MGRKTGAEMAVVEVVERGVAAVENAMEGVQVEHIVFVCPPFPFHEIFSCRVLVPRLNTICLCLTQGEFYSRLNQERYERWHFLQETCR